MSACQAYSFQRPPYSIPCTRDGMTLDELPSGRYFISAYAEFNFYAGRRLPTSKQSRTLIPSSRPHFYPNFFDDELEEGMLVDVAKDMFYYSSESAADWAFLDILDGDSPWAIAVRARNNVSTTASETDSVSALSSDSEGELSPTRLSPILSEAESLPSSDTSASEGSLAPSDGEDNLSRFHVRRGIAASLTGRKRRARVLTMVLDYGEKPPQVRRVHALIRG